MRLQDENGLSIFGNRVVRKGAIYSLPTDSDEIDQFGRQIAEEIESALSDGWKVQYGGRSAVQHRHFVVSRPKGRRDTEYHPAMPVAKSIHDSMGWHIDRLEEMIQALNVNLGE